MTVPRISKAEQEARKLTAETEAIEEENKHKAKLRKLELQQKQIELNKLKTEALKLEQEQEAHLLDLEKKRHDERIRLASTDFHHTFRFIDDVNHRSVGSCIQALDRWSRMSPGADLEIVFTSPGGSVYDGMALGDHLRSLSRKGHRIITGAEGFAASMAGILLQFGDHRWIGAESYILIHEVSFLSWGNTSEHEDNLLRIKMIQERVINLFLKNAERTIGPEHTLTPAQFRSRWKKTDWWLDSDETLGLGFADEVR